MYRTVTLIITFTVIIFCESAFGQSSFDISRTLSWSDSLRDYQFSADETVKTFYFDNANYDISQYGHLPFYALTCHLSGEGTPEVQLVRAQFAPVRSEQLVNNFDGIAKGISIKSEVIHIRKQPYAYITVLPFRRNPQTGQPEKLMSFSLHITLHPSLSVAAVSAHTYASSSVLANGTWYKIGVTQDGIYKLDKSFLQKLGINTGAIDPRNIQIYGNGGGMLPESTSVFRYDDLAQNAIEVTGEDDGSFDDGDYVLFFGQAPNVWKYNSNGNFSHVKNLYSDTTYYYLTIGNSPGKRMADRANSALPANQFVNTFDDYAFHEIDSSNLVSSGRQWVGESFGNSSSRTFNFSFPDITSSPMRVTVLALSRCTSGSSLGVQVNGANTGTMALPAVCYDFSSGGCLYASQTNNSFNVTASSAAQTVRLTYNPGCADAQGWLDYVELQCRRNLTMNGDQMEFRDSKSVGADTSQFTLSNASSNISIWDITTPVNPANQQFSFINGSAQFILHTDSLHQFIAFTGNSFLTPSYIGTVPNQNLHGLAQQDMIIVSPAAFMASANELAALHVAHDNLRVTVVDIDQVYNEFSSGQHDLTAIRDFVKMFFDRAGSDSTQLPKYLLLFGDGTYDPKNRLSGNTNFIPVYESPDALSINTFSTDDYFGILEDNSAGNITSVRYNQDIGVGRIPARTPDQAQTAVDKIINYKSPASLGNWVNSVTLIADNYLSDFFQECESVSGFTQGSFPVYNVDKIYVDAYQQVSFPGGARTPDATNALLGQFYQGTLIFDFVGHGGTTTLSNNRILYIDDVNSLTNNNRLPLFVSATCDYSTYDDPKLFSAGMAMYFNPKGGSIGMVTTVRSVFSSSNNALNNSFFDQIFLTVKGHNLTLGEALQFGKNNYFSDAVNMRKFCLLGDPALTLNFAQQKMITTSIKSENNVATDTLKALEKVTITGAITDVNGNLLTNFNGVAFPTVYDKPVTYKTLSNYNGSNTLPSYSFQLQNNTLYNGKVSVTNGIFTFSFVVPKDINYELGFGKISYYAEDSIDDITAAGEDDSILVGGIDNNALSDNEGPAVQLFMNNDNFKSGGITDPNPVIFMKLFDDNGINATGAGIGHDITGILDGDESNPFSMNNYYQADLDSYQTGEVHYPLHNLANGLHTLTVKAWDVYNNSAEASLDFTVISGLPVLKNVLTYPNPFTTITHFEFEHNITNESLVVNIHIFSIDGKAVRTIQRSIMSDGFLDNSITWDGTGDNGAVVERGVYIYKLTIATTSGLTASEVGKVVVLR